MPANKPKTQQTDEDRRKIDIEDDEMNTPRTGQSVGQHDRDQEHRGVQKDQKDKVGREGQTGR